MYLSFDYNIVVILTVFFLFFFSDYVSQRNIKYMLFLKNFQYHPNSSFCKYIKSVGKTIKLP